MLDRALGLVAGSDGFTRAWLAVWRADEAITLGRVEDALVDLDAAERALDAKSEPRGFVSPRGCAYNIRGHLGGIRAVALGLAGEVEAAEDALGAALAFGETGPRQTVVLLCRLGTVRVGSGDPEGACQALTDAHHIAERVGYRMGSERVRGVRTRFDARWRMLAAVQDLDEQLAAAA